MLFDKKSIDQPRPQSRAGGQVTRPSRNVHEEHLLKNVFQVKLELPEEGTGRTPPVP